MTQALYAHMNNKTIKKKVCWSHPVLFIQGYYNDSIFANEQLRQDTFKDWPHQYPDKILALAKAGLFYRGK
jgi:hypothetical protein